MQFHMPSKLYFGSGEIARLPEILSKDLKAEKPVLITDKGILNSGLVDKILPMLPNVRIYDDIEANPKSDTINRIATEMRSTQYDLVIGLGGGSPLDAGKALSLLATNNGEIQAYEGRKKYKNDPLPFLAIPTTCGTGSEVTWVSVITDVNRRFKMSIKGPKMYPAVSVVDPDLIKTLPQAIIASTGLDALTHAVEAYLSRPATLITDIHAEKAVNLILSSIEKAYTDVETHRVARENLMYGSTIAGFAFGNSDVTAVHCISESIGALYDIPHGVANSIFLPHVLAYNLPACVDKMGGLARKTGINKTDNQAAASAFIHQIKELSARLDIPVFKDLDIHPKKFDKISRMSLENNSNPSNPRPLGHDDYLKILENAYQ